MFKRVKTHNELIAGVYPERQLPEESWIDRQGARFFGALRKHKYARIARYRRFAKKVNAVSDKIQGYDQEQLSDFLTEVKTQLRQRGYRDLGAAAQSFALVREVARRELNMAHFDVQLIGGYVMLQGMVAEMQTGEGKTLTATLTAATAALSGVPVHVVTVNDYLAKRDAQTMSPVYEALGLSVGVIQQDMQPDQRKQAYARDITYCTNNELTFDYLKDRIVIGVNPSRTRMQLERMYGNQTKMNKLLLRGLHFVIVDEIDSVLIDEARTPLIISKSGDQQDELEMYQQALELAAGMSEKADYHIDRAERVVYLTDKAKEMLTAAGQVLGGVWKGKQRREELVTKALSAQLLFLKDKHYIIKDDKVQIVDEFTGRVMGDRSWEQGMHQMIEAKEGVELTGRRETLARISYQNYFRKYLQLSGMTGTASEVAAELWSVYRMTSVKVPTNKPNRRRGGAFRVFADADKKWRALTDRIEVLHRGKHPVLVGTRSVEDSETISELLKERALVHSVLNARQDEQEAQIIAQAGEAGRITVATNMAGRGTDIKLQSEVSEAGGLYVILTELHESKRIDRQLVGRCARQGDKGYYEGFLSMDDELATTYANVVLYRFCMLCFAIRLPFSGVLGKLCLRNGQQAAERRNSAIRQELLRADEKKDSALAFSGRFN